MRGLIERWSRWRESRQLARFAIPDPLWEVVLLRHPFIARRNADDQARLRTLCSLFLARKEFSGAQGLAVDDLMALSIAAQACLPILELGIEHYDGFVGIVVHPDEVLAAREQVDDDGVVHAYDELLSGEAMAGGPVMLSWPDVAQGGQEDADESAYNVVIHEFAHVLDMQDGVADGVPLLTGPQARSVWSAALGREFERFCDDIDQGDDSVLDPYGAEAPEEFFAVASEAFFVSPQALVDERPALFALLCEAYRQDPRR